MTVVRTPPQILRLVAGQEAILIKLQEKYRGERILPPRAKALLADPDTVIFAALEGKKFIGWIIGFVVEKMPGQALRIEDIQVDDQHQRQGVGKALLLKMLGFAESAKLAETFAHSTQSNTAVMALLRVSGMNRANNDDVLFQKKLKL